MGLFSLGALCAAAVPLALAEAFLRFNPPADLEQYLGESSRDSGVYRAHPELAATYCSWEAFHDQNHTNLAPHLPLTGHPDPRPVWALFGNSFIQAPGMLGDTLAAASPETRFFYLKRNELLPVRLAQIEWLLTSGFHPERIIIELMPIDTLPLIWHPLDAWYVTSRGSLTWRPQLPDGACRWLADHSRLALAAWVRSGAAERKSHDLCGSVDATLRGDLDRMFASLSRTSRACGVPVTILLIPAHEQSIGKATFAFQDSVTELLTPYGFQIIDPRTSFAGHRRPEELYLPDKHLSAAGNDLLVRELLYDTMPRTAMTSRPSSRPLTREAVTASVRR
jgi:hypothetical protein